MASKAAYINGTEDTKGTKEHRGAQRSAATVIYALPAVTAASPTPVSSVPFVSFVAAL
jgi:hypothetical protein